MKGRIPLIFWVVLLSFLIRLAFITFVKPTTISLEGDDAGYYQVTALQLREYFQKSGPLFKELGAGRFLQKRGLLEKYDLEIPWGAFKRGPVYPFFVALLFWFFGPHPFPVFVAQALLMSWVCGLIYGIGKELDQPWAGLLGAAIAAVYPPFIFIVSKMFQETLAIFLFSLFYFLTLRCRRKDSPWFLICAGGALFLLSLSRTPLAFFPFFLAATMVLTCAVMKKKFFIRRVWILLLAFLLPYGIWTSIVSWQFGRPAVVVEPVGREIFSAMVADYDGWTPDTFLGSKPDARAARVLRREKILSSSDSDSLEWPSQPKMVFAALTMLLEHPWVSLRLAVDKFRRLWWQPYDWPWREFLFPPEPLRWFHRALIVASLMGGLLWLLERPLFLSFLMAAPLYGSLFHSFFHIESRYGLIFLTLAPLFAGFFLCFLWRHRKILFFPLWKFTAGLAVVLGGGTVFYGAQLQFLLSVWPALNTQQARFLGVGIQSILLLGLFVLLGLWFSSCLSRKHLLVSLIVSFSLILIPFEVHALPSSYGLAWEAPVRGFHQEFRQEIFLPEGALENSVAHHLRMDLEIPQESSAWGIWVNGRRLGSLESLKAKVPMPFLDPPYRFYLQDIRKEPFQVRQWSTVPIPKGLLRENEWNTIEIRSEKGGVEENSLQAGEWKIFGDFPSSSTSTPPVFLGPLFQRSPTETSVFTFWYSGDFRLKGPTPLHHRGVRCAFYDGGLWRSDDLSPAPGIQRGEYRIRIGIGHPQGEFLVY